MKRSLMIFLPTLCIGCEDYALATSDDESADSSALQGASSPEAADDADGGGAAETSTWEPEVEDDFLALHPAATNIHVFVANPARNTVTRVSVSDLSVITGEVGIDPQVVETTPDYQKAVTFNKGSDSVSVIDAATLAVSHVDIRPNFNHMVMSPDGRYVACFHDSDKGTEDATGGAQSYNEVSLVNVDTLEHTALVAGFGPRDIQFTEDGDVAVVVSDTYLTIIDLTQDAPEATSVAITDDLVDPPEAEEVVLAPDGTYALVRQFGAVDELVVVDLDSLDVALVPVGDTPTDIDVTPDGEQAVAVARGSGELWLYNLGDIFGEPEVVAIPPEEIFGSVLLSPDGTQGLLYSTATGVSHYGAWDRNDSSDDAISVHALVKPVDSMAVSPTGGTALVFHDDSNGTDVDEDSEFYDAFALTLIDLSDLFSNPLRLPAEPTAYANTDDGARGFFIMDGQPFLEVLNYDTLLYDEVELKSDPVHIGVLPDSQILYASQEHDLGRISFFDADSRQLQTITGFELNSGIEH